MGEKHTGLTKYLIIRGKIIEVIFDTSDMLWKDSEEGIYAFSRDVVEAVDPVDRCGIGRISLSVEHPLTAACKVHDYMYESPAYQLFYTRNEADLWLKRHIRTIGRGKWYGFLSFPFYIISNIFGGKYWENKNTR